MGRTDGEMLADSTNHGYIVAVEWREKCEQLQREKEELARELQRLVKVNGQLMDERNKRDNYSDDENRALRLIVKHLVGLL